MNFRRWLTIGAVALGVFSAQAQGYTNLWTSGFVNGGLVPDGNTTGWSDSRTVTGFAGFTNGDVNVTLTLSGGYNGDLYAYLVHDNILVVLMNRVGVTSGTSFGYPQSGLDVVFDDQATTVTDIHSYETVVSWTITGGAYWRPDGRNISPISSGLTFDSATRQNSGNPLALFNGSNTDGEWTLFLADLSVGEDTTVTRWGISTAAAAAPEPGSATLVLLGAAALAVRRFRRKA